MNETIAYIITLHPPEYPALKAQREVLEAHGFHPVLVDGVRGSELSAGQYFKLIQFYVETRGIWMTPSEVGCTLSHLTAYRDLVQRGCHRAIVFEDDVLLDNLGVTRLKAILEDDRLSDAYISLGGQQGLEHFVERLRGTPVPGHDECWDLGLECLDSVHRTVGYVITRAIAESYLRLAELGAFTIDDFDLAADRSVFRRFILTNCVGHPRSLESSSIQSERNAIANSRRSVNAPLYKRIVAEFWRTVSARSEERIRQRRLASQAPIRFVPRF